MLSVSKFKSMYPTLSLALLFGWLLAFPMFGPWLAYSAGDSVGSMGITFLSGNVLGFMLLGLTHFKITSCRMRYTLAAILSGGSLIVLAASPQFLLGLAIMFVLGLVSSYLIVEWCRWFTQVEDPYTVMAICIIVSNAILVFALLPSLPPVVMIPLLVALPVVAAIYLKPAQASGERPLLPGDGASIGRSKWALGAFAIVAYFIGGLWYRVYAVPSFPYNNYLAIYDNVCYMVAIGFLAWWIKDKKTLAPIATVTLSSLGLGLLFAQSTFHGVARILLSIGLAGADYYFWLALWSLARFLPERKVFSFGHAFCLTQITMATLFDMFGLVQGYSRQTFYLVALGMTMVLLPVIFNTRFSLAKPAIDITAPSGLTEAESKVFTMLVRGASDQQIADELFISRHTVKFHVRNILHKFDVPNRKVLLSRLKTPPKE